MELMQEITTHLKNIQSDPNVKAAVLISGKPGNFIAGADIKMLQQCKSKEEISGVSQQGQQILQQIEDSSKPFVAAISGACLGGGLEVCISANAPLLRFKSSFTNQ